MDVYAGQKNIVAIKIYLTVAYVIMKKLDSPKMTHPILYIQVYPNPARATHVLVRVCEEGISKLSSSIQGLILYIKNMLS